MAAKNSLEQERKRWMAEADADTLARYGEIVGDSSRMSAAMKVAKQRAAELTKQASAMQRVAGGNVTKKKTVKK